MANRNSNGRFAKKATVIATETVETPTMEIPTEPEVTETPVEPATEPAVIETPVEPQVEPAVTEPPTALEPAPLPAELEANKRYLTTLENKLAIYMNKKMEGKANNILPGATVEIVKMGDTGILRVKRHKSKRTFYTPVATVETVEEAVEQTETIEA